MSLRQTIKNRLFRLFGKEPEAVVVSFLTGDVSQSDAMAADVRRLIPDRRHIRVGMQGANADVAVKGHTTWAIYSELKARLGKYRIGMAPLLLSDSPALRPLRRAAWLLAPRKILAYNQRLQRHHLQLRTLISSFLFLRGVPLDRIHLRPKWLVPWKRDRSLYPRTFADLAGRPTSRHRRRIAILTPYLPWPLSHGGAVRIYNLLREAASDFDIFLFAFRDTESDAEVAPLLDFCARVILVDKPRYREPRWCTLLPPEVHEFDSPTMRRLWRRVCKEHDIGLRQVEYTSLARYGGDILVEHDVTFDLFTQIHRRARILSSWWDLFRWRRHERGIVQKFRRVVVMSEKDAALLPGVQTAIINNGVDLDRFLPTLEMPGQRLLFVGSFRHFPNILAYRFFTEQVWPLIYAGFPEVTLTVIAGPDHLLPWREHTGTPCPPDDPWIEIHDFVADVRPFYVEANIVIVPTTVSAGTNLKVLEAMAMERAVVSTPSGCAGLGLEHGKNVWIADGDKAFAEGVARLLNDPDLRTRLAAAARRHVESSFDWRSLGTLQRGLYDELLPSTLQIRAATHADLPEMERIQIACAEASHWPPERYLAYTCRVAVQEGSVAGFLVSRQNGPGEREILNLAVAPEYRRRGVGTALMRDEIASASGGFFLEVRESNTGAQELYRRLGFRPAGKRPNYYDDPPETAVVMRLQS